MEMKFHPKNPAFSGKTRLRREFLKNRPWIYG
jgi:hypothetical protein